MRVFAFVIATTAPGLWSCAAFPAATASETLKVPADGRIEIAVGRSGTVEEVEFHVPPASVPEAVRQAAAWLAGAPESAEIEYVGGRKYYELSGRGEGGRAVEAMFYPDGTLYQLELERDAAAAPPGVAEQARAWGGAGEITSWEEIQDARRRTSGWHVKKTVQGIRYKLIFSAAGELQRVYRETPAEIEVAVGP